MALTRDEIKEALGQLPVLELVELINELETDWGVSAAAPVAIAAAPGAGAADGAAAEEEQTEFNVILSSFGDNKKCNFKFLFIAFSVSSFSGNENSSLSYCFSSVTKFIFLINKIFSRLFILSFSNLRIPSLLIFKLIV